MNKRVESLCFRLFFHIYCWLKRGAISQIYMKGSTLKVDNPCIKVYGELEERLFVELEGQPASGQLVPLLILIP